MPAVNNSVLALDVGEKRVGVALTSFIARLPSPKTTLLRGPDFFDKLGEIITNESVSDIVIGLPRGLEGQTTDQTITIADFTRELKTHFDLPIHFQDEALTSKQAEQELGSRRKAYDKKDIDALAATYILQDWLNEHEGSL